MKRLEAKDEKLSVSKWYFFLGIAVAKTSVTISIFLRARQLPTTQNMLHLFSSYFCITLGLCLLCLLILTGRVSTVTLVVLPSAVHLSSQGW